MSASRSRSTDPAPGDKYGEQGNNTPPACKSSSFDTVTAPDGYKVVAPGDMYRFNELSIGRREPQFVNLHNLADCVITRTLEPPMPLPADRPEVQRRALLWDKAAKAVIEALATIPSGSHVVVCANSGPYAASLESLPPWTTVAGAVSGLVFVAEFRDETRVDVHKGWKQIATPINSTEGRLLAGLRLLPAITGRKDLTFTITNLTNPTVPIHQMNIVKDSPHLQYGCVANSWKPTNLGCFYHPGCLFAAEYDIFRASFAWDGDLYGWDEAMLYTRKPVALINDKKPERRFDYWYEGTVLRDVTWLQIVDGRLRGGLHKITTRADVIEWDETGVPGSFLDEASLSEHTVG
ncbi:hypothetical protein GE09DRAFT_1048364 [Coniochaeta sp. 2T2.1]|nr:hypothetical protein GE09DRAFT_1048364 [Coniochaeta sp. 2T2.1]